MNYLKLNEDNDEDKDDNTSMDTNISFSTMYSNPMNPFAFPSMPFPESNWMLVYRTNSKLDNKPNEAKMNVLFRTNVGRNINLIIEQEKTIQELILAFFKKINNLDLNEDDVYFIYNAHKINYNDETKLRDYFRMASQPIIYVNDTRNLIGAN